MRSSTVVGLVLAGAAGMAIVSVGSGPQTSNHTEALQASQISRNPFASLDDEMLWREFTDAMRRAKYPRLDVYWSQQVGNLAEPIRDMREELERRGKARWENLFKANVIPQATGLSDASLLILLYGMPTKWESSHADYYGPVIRRILTKGGEWYQLAADWHWSELQVLSDGMIQELWEQTRNTGAFRGNEQRDVVLTEMIRRGGLACEKMLSDELRNRVPKDSDHDMFAMNRNIEILTALRRIQGKRDPLGIHVDQPLVTVVQFPHLPTFGVALVNQDEEKSSIVYTSGGDYRTGRQARWRIEATGSDGKKMKTITEFGGFMAGGVFSRGIMSPGDKWETQLNAESYLPALPPGEYSLRIMYHDEMTIADRDNVAGLIVSYSPDIHLTVTPLVVRLTAADSAGIRKRVLAIRDEPMKLVAGTYGEWAHELVSPESDRGKVLIQGLDAVPTLVAMLEELRLTPRQRAEVLGLLYSLTGQNDPRDGLIGSDLLGSYQAKQGPWALAANGYWMGMGWSGTQDAPGATIDVGKQKVFAERWKVWKEYVKVEAPK